MKIYYNYVAILELTINQTQVDEVGIRFPDVSLENDTKHLEDYSTFLQLPQQISITKKGINYERSLNLAKLMRYIIAHKMYNLTF